MVELTRRMALPLIVPGQAQKEMTHNEALALIDMALHPEVLAIGTAVPPSTPAPGDCWIIGEAPVDEWAGHATHVAGWTAGGWRFSTPRPGMVFGLRSGGTARWIDGQGWVVATPATIADPTGGDVIDPAARTAIANILATLRTHGLVA